MNCMVVALSKEKRAWIISSSGTSPLCGKQKSTREEEMLKIHTISPVVSQF